MESSNLQFGKYNGGDFCLSLQVGFYPADEGNTFVRNVGAYVPG